MARDLFLVTESAYLFKAVAPLLNRTLFSAMRSKRRALRREKNRCGTGQPRGLSTDRFLEFE